MSEQNPDLDYGINSYVFVSDKQILSEEDICILKEIQKSAKHQKLYCIGDRWFSNDNIKQANTNCRQYDREHFDRFFSELKTPINRELLLDYAKQMNPEFHKVLMESKQDMKELIWQEYQRAMDADNNLHVSVQQIVADRIAEKCPDSHIVMVLFNHKVRSPQTGNDGILDYHFVGRGFYGFGNNSQISSGIGKSGRYKVTVCLAPLENLDLESRLAFTRKLFHHEWTGHVYHNLADHFVEPPEKCVMYVEPSLEQTVANAKRFDKELFCNECKKKING